MQLDENTTKKLNQIKSLVEELLQGQKNFSKKPSVSQKKDKPSPKISYVDIINKIKDLDEYEVIESKILDVNSNDGKILLPFYVCHKFFPECRLGTTDIEHITSELDIKIANSNVATKIKKGLKKYLESDKVRVKGQRVNYKLNRQGVKFIENIIYDKS